MKVPIHGGDVERGNRAQMQGRLRGSLRHLLAMDQIRRGNYDSGRDYVLEYGDLRFTFNERDFSERVEQAANKLGFVGSHLEETGLEDLVEPHRQR